MLDICLLGTGGMMPLPDRFLTSLLVRYNGNSVLIDCGEGTQVAIKKKRLECQPDRAYLHNSLSWRPCCRDSGTFAFYRQFRKNRTYYYLRA